MLKRHSISSPVRAQNRVAIICLLTLIVGSQHVSAQSQLAQDTYAIFEGSCLICHGPDGAYRETLLMEHRRAHRRGAPLFREIRMPPNCINGC